MFKPKCAELTAKESFKFLVIDKMPICQKGFEPNCEELIVRSCFKFLVIDKMSIGQVVFD